MSTEQSEFPVLAQFPPAACALKLRELGDDSLADDFDQLSDEEEALGLWGTERTLRPWQHIAHNFGFIAPDVKTDYVAIQSAGNMNEQRNLIGTRVKIKLYRLFVAEYPGSGEHTILFSFSAANHIGGDKGAKLDESLRCNMTVRARNRQHTGIINWPIFSGLTVGPEGVAFECTTVNVKNSDDEELLSIIDSGTVEKGLRLLTSAQPAILPLVGLSKGILQAVAKRHRNVPVQSFKMGLDYDKSSLGARLAEGAYVAVQAPTSTWNWEDYAFDNVRGQLVTRQTRTPVEDFNYVAFGVAPLANT